MIGLSGCVSLSNNISNINKENLFYESELKSNLINYKKYKNTFGNITIYDEEFNGIISTDSNITCIIVGEIYEVDYLMNNYNDKSEYFKYVYLNKSISDCTRLNGSFILIHNKEKRNIFRTTKIYPFLLLL